MSIAAWTSETLDRVVDIGLLADSVLAPAERSRLLSAPASRRNELFLSCWTLKEAYAKARGLGLHMPFEKCAFEFSSEGILVHLDASLDDEETDWHFAAVVNHGKSAHCGHALRYPQDSRLSHYPPPLASTLR